MKRSRNDVSDVTVIGLSLYINVNFACVYENDFGF